MMTTSILAALQRLHKVSPAAPPDHEKQPPFNELPTPAENSGNNVPVNNATEQPQNKNEKELHPPPKHPPPP